jgi:hypothetical protein
VLLCRNNNIESFSWNLKEHFTSHCEQNDQIVEVYRDTVRGKNRRIAPLNHSNIEMYGIWFNKITLQIYYLVRLCLKYFEISEGSGAWGCNFPVLIGRIYDCLGCRFQLALRVNIVTCCLKAGRLVRLSRGNGFAKRDTRKSEVSSPLPSAWGYNRATLFLGDINTGTWPARLGESQTWDSKMYCIGYCTA